VRVTGASHHCQDPSGAVREQVLELLVVSHALHVIVGEHGVDQAPGQVDLNSDDVAGAEVASVDEADAGRGSGEDHIAGLQRGQSETPLRRSRGSDG